MSFPSNVLIGLVFFSGLCSAQQSVTRPVLSALPPAVADPTPSPSVPAPVSAAAAPLPAQVASDYVIGPDDAITVTVWKEPGLSGPLSVRPDGKISVPLVGDVPAAGLTPMLLGTDLAARLKKYINDPLVTVTITAVNSKHIFLLGEVQHIGALALIPGMSLLQAISAAGGLTPYANAKHIYILRNVRGQKQKIPFNYKKALKDGDQQGISLAPDDTIVVP